jgi:hypothetical protein
MKDGDIERVAAVLDFFALHSGTALTQKRLESFWEELKEFSLEQFEQGFEIVKSGWRENRMPWPGHFRDAIFATSRVPEYKPKRTDPTGLVSAADEMPKLIENLREHAKEASI